MQKVIIAGSLAVLASGVVIPKEAMKKKFMTKLTTADMSRTSASLASATPRVTTQDAVVSTLRGGSKIRGKQGKGKGKGRDDDENGDAEGSTRKFFEYSVGPSDACSSDERFYTVGFELGVCQNYVDKLDNGYGEPRSHRWVQGENGGAVMQEAFLSHNCMGDVAASMQLPTEELGFPTGYVVGKDSIMCVRMFIYI